MDSSFRWESHDKGHVDIEKEFDMSHPRQDDDRRLGDNDEAEATNIPSTHGNPSVSKGKAATPEDQNSERRENTTSKS